MGVGRERVLEDDVEGGEVVEEDGQEGGQAADARARWAMLVTLLRLSAAVAATLG